QVEDIFDHNSLSANIPKKSLHRSMNISRCSNQSSNVLLCVKETHFLELS
ncbi:Os03g0131333, partial [Oryza sativa Japonica Group]